MWGLLFKGSVLTYNPTANGAEWVPIRGTTRNLPPAEDVSAQELSNIMIQDPPEDAQRVDCFEECQEGCSAEAPAKAFCTGATFHEEEEEAMEQAPPDREEVGSESSEESEESEEESEVTAQR